MRALAEMQRALPARLAVTRPLMAVGCEGAARRRGLGLLLGLVRRPVRTSSFVPHGVCKYYKVPLVDLPAKIIIIQMEELQKYELV